MSAKDIDGLVKAMLDEFAHDPKMPVKAFPSLTTRKVVCAILQALREPSEGSIGSIRGFMRDDEASEECARECIQTLVDHLLAD